MNTKAVDSIYYFQFFNNSCFTVFNNSCKNEYESGGLNLLFLVFQQFMFYCFQ